MVNDIKDKEQKSSSEPEVDAGPPKPSGPFARIFAPSGLVWNESIRMASDKNIRVEDLALCCAQDPVIVMELLKTANALYFSAGRPPITTTATAITRLGSDVVILTLQSLSERSPLENSEQKKLFELHRNRGKRCAIIARMLAELTAKTLQDDCHTAGLFMFVGDLLAVAHLGQTYVKLHATNSPSGLLYKLAQEHRFDVEKMGLGYLQRLGIPDLVLFAIDREGKTKSQERAIMKPVCFAAAEIVDAFDSNKWEKLAPGKTIPPKSSLRLLKLSDGQYLKLYERASEYLFSEKMAQERLSLDDLTSFNAPSALDDNIIIVTGADSVPAPSVSGVGSNQLNDEFESLMDPSPSAPPSAPVNVPPSSSAIVSARANDATAQLAEKFNIRKEAPPKTKARVESSAPVVPPPPLRTGAGNAFVAKASAQLDGAKSSEDLLRSILGILTEEGPFEKSALIVVSKDRKNAVVIAARGPSITNGQTLVLEDPLSPLAQCFSKIQSFGNRSSADSPWGSKAFALAPIDADHETPVALYADCGTSGSLTFEARRIFRVVVDLLNQKLPAIPGGIPVEV
jgi:HD-like signal output (HDOD) protein